MRQRCLLLVVILCLTAALPGRAFAHPEIVRTEPAADAQLTSAPTVVRIFFNESIEAEFSMVELFDAQRRQVDAGGSGRAASDPTVLELPLPALGPGLYTVVWQTIGSDGHKVIGNFVFTVLGAEATAAAIPTPNGGPTPTPVVLAPPVQPSATASVDMLPLLLSLLRAIMLLAALATLGGWFIGAGVLYRSITTHARPARVAAIQRWRRVEWAGLVLLLLATIGFAIAQTATVAGNVDLASLRKLLFGTRLGQAVAARLCFTVLLIARLAITSRERIRFGASTWLLGGGLLLTFSLSGHAAAQPDPFFPVLADVVHLTATAVWVGGLILLVVALPAVLSALNEKDRINTSARVIERFSTHALLSVLALTVSGTYAALLHLTTVSDLWASDYGRALLVKIGVFSVLLLLGAYNMLIVRPRFTAWTKRMAESVLMLRWQQRFQSVMRVEVVLAIVAIGAVGFLTNSPPPSVQARRPATPVAAAPSPEQSPSVAATPRPTRTPVPSRPFSQTQAVKDLQIGLEVTPASIGENSVRVTVQDANGTPKDIQKVLLAFEMLEMEMGVTETDAMLEGNGRFVADKSWLSMVGTWRVRVTVRRSDADDIEAEFMVPVGG
jgi:copper transport protein